MIRSLLLMLKINKSDFYGPDFCFECFFMMQISEINNPIRAESLTE